VAIPAKLKIKINLIGFLLISFLLIFLMATQVLSILQGMYTVNAIFPDAGGVFTDQEVTYRGLTVGRVGDMEVVPQGVKIELLIEDDYKIPAENTEARVMFKSAVGEQFIDVLPASDSEPYLEDGSTIPITHTDIPVSTQALLSTTDTVLKGVPPEALKGAIDSLAEGLSGRGQDIALTLESLADLSETFAARAPEVEGILRNGTELGDAFLESSDDFKVAIRELVEVADLLADNRFTIQDLMENANLTSDELVSLIRNNRGNLNKVIIQLAKINEFQAESGDDLARLFRLLPDGLEGVVKTFEPKTGLVRFGLVNDNENHGCNYSTRDRNPPQDRNTPNPQKYLKCRGAIDGGGGRSGDASGSGTTGGSDIPTLTESLAPDIPADDPGLSGRMKDMAWMLFYFNGLQ
jgi:phospholipid/cholesterol/gamma-HCH transport system substrate-binding protein